MTERFNANSEGTTISTSGIGPTGSGSSLVALGLGQGPGQTANNQENNQFAQFEYPIKWDDLANALGRLGEKQKVDELLDDMSTRDRVLEDYLNTNVVNGIVAGARVSINRAAGVVTITAASQAPGAWTAFTPTVVMNSGATASLSSNGSAYVQWGSIVHVRINCNAFVSPSSYPVRIDDLPVAIKAAVNSATNYSVGMTESGGWSAHLLRNETTPNTRLIYYYPAGVPSNLNNWDIGATITYEAA